MFPNQQGHKLFLVLIEKMGNLSSVAKHKKRRRSTKQLSGPGNRHFEIITLWTAGMFKWQRNRPGKRAHQGNFFKLKKSGKRSSGQTFLAWKASTYIHTAQKWPMKIRFFCRAFLWMREIEVKKAVLTITLRGRVSFGSGGFNLAWKERRNIDPEEDKGKSRLFLYTLSPLFSRVGNSPLMKTFKTSCYTSTERKPAEHKSANYLIKV